MGGVERRAERVAMQNEAQGGVRSMFKGRAEGGDSPKDSLPLPCPLVPCLPL